MGLECVICFLLIVLGFYTYHPVNILGCTCADAEMCKNVLRCVKVCSDVQPSAAIRNMCSYVQQPCNEVKQPFSHNRTDHQACTSIINENLRFSQRTSAHVLLCKTCAQMCKTCAGMCKIVKLCANVGAT